MHVDNTNMYAGVRLGVLRMRSMMWEKKDIYTKKSGD